MGYRRAICRVEPGVDAETGFQYLRARYYDPATGNFLTRDPIEALTREPYGYVGGNPLNATDPSGLWCLAYNNEGWLQGGRRAARHAEADRLHRLGSRQRERSRCRRRGPMYDNCQPSLHWCRDGLFLRQLV